MLSKIEKAFMILLIGLALFNIFAICYRYNTCTNFSTNYDGGLGTPEFNLLFGILLFIAQIINIILLIVILKEKNSRKKINICFLIVLAIFIITVFAPVGSFPLVQQNFRIY